MNAAAAFAAALTGGAPVVRVQCTLMGSLAWTGDGHATDDAVLLGLMGVRPDTLDPDDARQALGRARREGRLVVAGTPIAFDPERDIVFDRQAPTPIHPNTLAFDAFDEGGRPILHQRWCSIGGGFIVPEERVGDPGLAEQRDVPHPFATAERLLEICASERLSIGDVVRANESGDAAEVDARIDRLIDAMTACIDRGLQGEGLLPGRLGVRRRAKALAERLEEDRGRNRQAPHEAMDRVSLYAIAVNEENAAGGRVVTAPTNGAAGVVPAVLRYYRESWPGADREGERRLLLAATAVGALIKTNASISGAEVGCQGEVGTASAMAAAGLAEAMGGSPAQVENAAEMAMEHHLGMTCDPIGGLVQVPCIERNAFGAMKAITAASLALRGDGRHLVSLDQVVETMFRTGRDMHSKYKETSQGGLAVSFPEC